MKVSFYINIFIYISTNASCKRNNSIQLGGIFGKWNIFWRFFLNCIPHLRKKNFFSKTIKFEPTPQFPLCQNKALRWVPPVLNEQYLDFCILHVGTMCFNCHQSISWITWCNVNFYGLFEWNYSGVEFPSRAAKQNQKLRPRKELSVFYLINSSIVTFISSWLLSRL